ncbi:MAG TPA: DUF2510 domain-containing protein [Acidimicrobiales bacterium]|nr:DUF2510 domain-containing protein [Acidimicrobiales bacterium]
MGTVLNPSGPVFAALSTTTKVIEVAIVVVVVVLLIVTLVLYRRKSAPPKPVGAVQATSNQYYGDVASIPGGQAGAAGGPQGLAAPNPRNDPFAGFASPAPVPAGSAPAPGWTAPAGAAPAQPEPPVPEPYAPPPPPPPPPPAAPAPAPPPGTPAGWLPEPSGVPNTLRYWDGTAWTQHVAQRS